MPRILDEKTLSKAARDYAGFFLLPTQYSVHDPERPIHGRDWVMRNLWNVPYMDVHDLLVKNIKGFLGKDAIREFDELAKEMFTPRDPAVHEQRLAERLAINPAGEHIPGKIGSVKVGGRIIGQRLKMLPLRGGPVAIAKNVQWPIYAGEEEERSRGDKSIADPIPEYKSAPIMGGATNTRISNEAAILGCNAVVDNLDEGTGAATVEGRSGAQPADPDSATTGTLLFTLTCSATAFGNAADGTGKATATAASVTDDTSADATGTLGYCRASSEGTGQDPQIDGEAGTSGADFNFNTLSIVAGSTVSLTSWTVSLPES